MQQKTANTRTHPSMQINTLRQVLVSAWKLNALSPEHKIIIIMDFCLMMTMMMMMMMMIAYLPAWKTWLDR